jgi:hypothetical protein
MPDRKANLDERLCRADSKRRAIWRRLGATARCRRGHSAAQRTKDRNSGQFTSQTELEGIDCALESEGYRASIKTPAEIKVPDYGYASRPVSVHCQAPGYKTGFASVQPYDKTSAERLDAASNNGLVSIVAVALIDAATDKKKHDYSYRPVSVTMNRIGCEKEKSGCR